MDLRIGEEEVIEDAATEAEEDSRRRMSSGHTDTTITENVNPYSEELARNRPVEAEWEAIQRALNSYDEMNKMAEYNIDPSIWERLYKARLKKAAKEFELKAANHRLNNVTAFLQVSETYI